MWKRAARKRGVPGSDTPKQSGAPMPAEKMMKWGFLVKHERWLAVDGFSVTVNRQPLRSDHYRRARPTHPVHGLRVPTRFSLSFVRRCSRSALSRM